MRRGEVWWADLPDPEGSEPGYRRPVVILQGDYFNQSGLKTVIIAVITGNLAMGNLVGNLPIARRDSGLPRDAVVNMSQIFTIDRSRLIERVKRLPPFTMAQIERVLQIVFDIEPQ